MDHLCSVASVEVGVSSRVTRWAGTNSDLGDDGRARTFSSCAYVALNMNCPCEHVYRLCLSHIKYWDELLMYSVAEFQDSGVTMVTALSHVVGLCYDVY
jgi:hypothetical protein